MVGLIRASGIKTNEYTHEHSRTAINSGPPHPFIEFWHYFRQNRGALGGLFVICILLIMALLAPLLVPHDPNEQFRDALLVPPFWQEGGSTNYLLVTDDIGRDIFSRIVYGARISLSVVSWWSPWLSCLVSVLG